MITIFPGLCLCLVCAKQGLNPFGNGVQQPAHHLRASPPSRSISYLYRVSTIWKTRSWCRSRVLILHATMSQSGSAWCLTLSVLVRRLYAGLVVAGVRSVHSGPRSPRLLSAIPSPFLGCLRRMRDGSPLLTRSLAPNKSEGGPPGVKTSEKKKCERKP